MKQITKLFVVAALAMTTLGGCYTATFYRDVAPKGATQDEWRAFWLFGIVGEQVIDVREFCEDGNVRRVKTGANAGTAIVSALTLGIYAPRKVYVQCGTGEEHRKSTHAAETLIAMDTDGTPLTAISVDRSGRKTQHDVRETESKGVWQVNRDMRKEVLR